MSIFSLAYTVRGLFDIFIFNAKDFNLGIKFQAMWLDLLVILLCEYVPIMLLMIFHYRNFRVKNTKRTSTDTQAFGDEDQEI